MALGPLDKLLSLDARGAFGFSGGFGKIRFGYTKLGYYTKYAGIYSKQHNKKPFAISLKQFYRPSNPKTVKQMNWRYTLAYFWEVWYTLTPTEKESWRLKGMKKKMTGANAFMSQQLKNPTGGFGKILFSYNRFGFR